MNELTEGLRIAMEAYFDKPYAIFGHSFGALLAFDLAQTIARRGGPSPRHIFVSGCPAPADCTELFQLHLLSDEDLIAAVNKHQGIPEHVLANPALLSLTMSVLRTDLRIAASFNQFSACIKTPISAFFGVEDPNTSPSTVNNWQQHTQGLFAAHSFSGNHFFLHEHTAALLEAIGQEISS
jgi:surfactin synthase thioesterase subunit